MVTFETTSGMGQCVTCHLYATLRAKLFTPVVCNQTSCDSRPDGPGPIFQVYTHTDQTRETSLDLKLPQALHPPCFPHRDSVLPAAVPAVGPDVPVHTNPFPHMGPYHVLSQTSRSAVNGFCWNVSNIIPTGKCRTVHAMIPRLDPLAYRRHGLLTIALASVQYMSFRIIPSDSD